MSSAPAAVKTRSPRHSSARACPLCGGVTRFSFRARDLNRATSEQRFAYSRCGSCGTYFLVDPPRDMAPYYPAAYYELPSVEQLELAAASEQFKVEMLLEHVEPGKLVEVGPGVGIFAIAARNAGFDVTGIEMDARTCEHLRALRVNAIESSAPEEVLRSLAPVRAVVLWHVIEHLPRPSDVIKQAAESLEPGGVLAIAAPNPQSLQFRVLRQRWAHVDAPRHLFLIPAQALAQHCARAGLKQVYTTTSDPAGRYWNTFGWDYALRRSPRSQPGTRARQLLSHAVASLFAPVEARRDRGCAYTSIFVKGQVA
jgi:2-polyprenyl-3-methyl-5-hydroxy-6-metoxy-1,4-benzoquinol methylase